MHCSLPCSSPGFSEFLLWQCEDDGRPVAGWGISLGGQGNGQGEPCPWRIGTKQPRRAGAPRYQLCYGSDGTGDLYSLNNVDHFVRQVVAENGGLVQLCVADGGFAAARDQHNQELIMGPLITAETLAAVRLLLPGGTYVCKLFDAVERFTVSLIRLLHGAFSRIALVKPITSRSASSERYLVCEGFKLVEDTPAMIAVLERLKCLMSAFNAGEPAERLVAVDPDASGEAKAEGKGEGDDSGGGGKGGSPGVVEGVAAAVQSSTCDELRAMGATAGLEIGPTFRAYITGVNDRNLDAQIVACEEILAAAAVTADEEGSAPAVARPDPSFHTLLVDWGLIYEDDASV
mmetsp:Transcript_26537/g.62237  ORF Transcript_26537/g.62237 Transcript_26537/m.62237 type:complete len:346 (-) Transcript_26537:47-1084(-)